MIDLYYWPTPNGHKITIFLEEAGLKYKIIPVNIGEGDQFRKDFLKISPNNKMPAIVDRDAEGGALSLFESGAILQYLAEKTGKFLPGDTRGKYNVLQWLTWQVAGLGPMMGQASHFVKYAPQVAPDADHSYGRERYVNETRRLYGVMDRQLARHDYLAGAYSIADMAAYPWAKQYESYGLDVSEWPNLARWLEALGGRPAVKKAYRIGEKIRKPKPELSKEEIRTLFGKR